MSSPGTVTWRAAARELLVTAYHALGREALASRVEVHHAHRALDKHAADHLCCALLRHALGGRQALDTASSSSRAGAAHPS